jgi:hypothetical protein
VCVLVYICFDCVNVCVCVCEGSQPGICYGGAGDARVCVCVYWYTYVLICECVCVCVCVGSQEI